MLRIHRAVTVSSFIAVAIVCFAPAAAAQQHVGFLGGVSVEPEQAVAGVFWQSPAIVGPLRFRGGVDAGLADEEWFGTINLDAVFRTRLRQSRWTLQQGGGPVIGFSRVDTGPFRSDVDTVLGVSYLVDVVHDAGFFAAFRVSAGDVPRLKFGVGWLIPLD